MALDAALQNADLDTKIGGLELAFDHFINDPMQSTYAQVYVATLKEVVDSIVGDFERDVDFQDERINELQEKVSDLSWALNPDMMGK